MSKASNAVKTANIRSALSGIGKGLLAIIANPNTTVAIPPIASMGDE